MAVTIVRTTTATQLNSLLSQASASATYLTQVSASTVYLTNTSASTNYLTQTSASTTYAAKSLETTVAQLSTTPVGTIVMYGGTTAPTGWLLCNGQSTSGYAALAAVVGDTVPDLRGRAPIGYGSGSGLTERTTIGATTGAETHTLTVAQIPGHTHSVTIMGSDLAYGTAALQGSNGGTQQSINAAEGGGSNPAGGGSHPIMQPSTVVNFIIKT